MNKYGVKEISANLDASGTAWAIIVSRFNSLITERLLEGALDALERHGAKKESLEIIRVPGAFELPWAAKLAAEKGKYSGIICLGAVIRGDTAHFEMVANETTKGLAAVSLESGIPLGFGVLTTEDLEQALERAGSKGGNAGFSAAVTAIEGVRLKEALS